MSASNLDEFADELEANGFRVHRGKPYSKRFGEDPATAWLHFEIDGKIGYVQKDGWIYGGFEFTTVHKPNRTTGIGFRAFDSGDLTIEKAKATCNMFAPVWATARDRKSVVKYANLDEFLADALALAVSP